jgi:hypothetical protein
MVYNLIGLVANGYINPSSLFFRLVNHALSLIPLEKPCFVLYWWIIFLLLHPASEEAWGCKIAKGIEKSVWKESGCFKATYSKPLKIERKIFETWKYFLPLHPATEVMGQGNERDKVKVDLRLNTDWYTKQKGL